MPDNSPKTIHLIIRSLATKKRTDVFVKSWEVRESRDSDWKFEAWLSYYAVRKLGNVLGDDDSLWRMVKPVKDGRCVVKGIVNCRLMFGEKEKKMKKLINTETALASEDARERFAKGWSAAGGPTDDADAVTPWHAPWEWARTIAVTGETPEEWGASWYEANREEIDALREAEERERALAEED